MLPDERDPALLLDMLNAARNVVAIAEGKTFADYEHDLQFRCVTERLIEIIGEAARGVSQELRGRHTEIPWSGIIAQQNVLAHEYGRIKNDRIWEIVSTHIPELIRHLEPLIPLPPQSPED